MMTVQLTADDIRALNEWFGVDAALVRWADTGEIRVLPLALLGDIAFDDRHRDHEVLITHADLRELGGTDWDNATDADYDAWAEALTETLSNARRDRLVHSPES